MSIDTNALLKAIEDMGYTGEDLIIRQAFKVNEAADIAYCEARRRCDADDADQANSLRQASKRILARLGYEGKG